MIDCLLDEDIEEDEVRLTKGEFKENESNGTRNREWYSSQSDNDNE